MEGKSRKKRAELNETSVSETERQTGGRAKVSLFCNFTEVEVAKLGRVFITRADDL